MDAPVSAPCARPFCLSFAPQDEAGKVTQLAATGWSHRRPVEGYWFELSVPCRARWKGISRGQASWTGNERKIFSGTDFTDKTDFKAAPPPKIFPLCPSVPSVVIKNLPPLQHLPLRSPASRSRRNTRRPTGTSRPGAPLVLCCCCLHLCEAPMRVEKK
jgi:hypothetical protein